MVEFNWNKKSVIILLVKFIIMAVCITVTGWQIVLCIEKFASSPLSTNIGIQDVAKGNLPDVTFCVGENNIYNQTLLQECEIEFYSQQWSSELCPDPGKLFDELYPSEHFINFLVGHSWSPYKLEFINVTNLRRSSIDCFTIPINEAFDSLNIEFKTNTSTICIHQKGNFKKYEDKPIQIDDKMPNIQIDLDYEVIQNTENDECIHDVSYIKEDCIWNELYEESMTAYGCITPYGPTNQ